MLTSKFSFKLTPKPLKDKTTLGAIRSLFKVGAYLRKASRNTLKTPGKKYVKEVRSRTGRKKGRVGSKPGTPPFSHPPQKVLKNSILFEVDKTLLSVQVGPSGDATDGFAKHHEFGIPRGGTNFKKRAFMGPALTKALPKLPQEFANIV